MGIVERSKELYERYLNDDSKEKLATLSAGDAAYFWTMLYYRMEEVLNKELLRRIEEELMYGSRHARLNAIGLDGIAKEESATPFSDAERSIGPSSWFGNLRLIK